MSPPPPVAPARNLPALAWVGIVGGAVLIAALVTLLVLILGVLQDSRVHIRSQDAKITALYTGAQPLADDAKPLIRQARPALRNATAFVASLRRGLRQLRGEAPTLAAAADAVPPLLRATTALADGALPLVRELDAADSAGVLADLGSLVDQLAAGDRFVRTLDATNTVLSQVQAEDLIGVLARGGRLAPKAARRLRLLLKTQRATLRTQRKSLEVQRTTMGYTLRAAEAAESLDRKTGGQFPPTAAAP